MMLRRKKLFKGNQSHENSILGIYKTVPDGAFKDTYFENIYQNEALPLSSASTSYECHTLILDIAEFQLHVTWCFTVVYDALMTVRYASYEK